MQGVCGGHANEPQLFRFFRNYGLDFVVVVSKNILFIKVALLNHYL
ncbi:hypothetical protein DR116_0024845 [Bacillus cereus]|uniref:Uncharacterized protein n=1 Tax=Bacillus cereus TaxID=1396 RepID=A0A9X8NTL0_BACCE|nr:hypothetical protein DR116_0024845 [Bacillus cereus]